MLGSVHSLPVELLARIFLLGSNFNYPYVHSPFLFDPVVEPYQSPSASFQVVVSQVCRKWRQIATVTPSLWSWIHFRQRSHIERGKVFLSRCSPRIPGSYTSSHLIDILIATVSSEERANDPQSLHRDELEEIFEILVQVTPRWHSFHLDVRDGQCKAVARHYLSSCGPAPHLSTLQLFHFEDLKGPEDLYLATYRPPVICFDNNVPNLKHVSLIGVNMPWRRTALETISTSLSDNFKMDNLESLELALHVDAIRPPYQYWERMLQQSSGLRSLSLHYSGPKRPDESDPLSIWPASPHSHSIQTRPRPISLPCLTHLSLVDLDDSRYACDILERLYCESLTTLKLGLPSPREDEEDSDLTDAGFTPLLELLKGSISDPSDGLPSTSSSISPWHSPLPNIHHLHTLILTAIDCSFVAFQAFFDTLIGLKMLDIDFARLRMTDEDGATTKDAWEAFIARPIHMESNATPYPNSYIFGNISDNRGTMSFHVSVPILERFSMHGLSGTHISNIILSRFSVKNCSLSRSSLGKDVRFTMPVFAIRYGEKQRAHDVILGRLVMNGGLAIQSCEAANGEDVPFIHCEFRVSRGETDTSGSFDDNDEEDDEEYD